MTGIYKFQTSRLAKLALWQARLSAPVAILSFLLMRFAGLHPSIALYCFAAAVLMATLSILTSWAAFPGIWFKGMKGGKWLWGAFVRSLFVLLPAAVFAYFYFTTPPFSDLSTNPVDPPEFTVAWQLRQDQDNDLTIASLAEREQQALAFPELESLEVNQPIALMQMLIADELAKRKWNVLRADEATENTEESEFEASTRSIITGLVYVMSIRLRSDGEETTILDMRSASLWGPRDFGLNAGRIKSFLVDVRSRIDQGVQRYELKLEELERLRRLQQGPLPRPRPKDLGPKSSSG
ncbi:DUF1499 domain-containing protein [uncultured Cohaesibacter sp.]|uniref:DUF1499 domain-containing protein n=1 Tax=uncultured Cohaesibacter sp. TaxID=1002546 RepID=UPI002930E8F4|nr:DUF1499 domain-containing protein [uncultured Cohaesibacter sp.]